MILYVLAESHWLSLGEEPKDSCEKDEAGWKDGMLSQHSPIDWMSTGDRRPRRTLRSVVSLGAKRFSVLWEQKKKKCCRF